MQNGRDKEDAFLLFTQLINDGIEKYVDNSFDIIKQADIIETIFQKIILLKFNQEYSNITKYNNDNEIYYYQPLLFNKSDLMCLIFQYMPHCSLVCSYWLYHAMNPNSIYDFDLYRMMKMHTSSLKN